MPTIGKPITASARRIRFARNTPPKIREEPWQDRAWEVYDRLGEIFFMTRYRKGIAGRIDYFIATQDDPQDDPTPIKSGPVLDAFNELGGSRMVKRIVSGLMPHWDVPGEGYVVGFDEEPKWRVLSTQELKRKTDRLMAWFDEDETEVGVIEEDQVFRVWLPHPRFAKQADSPTRHVLEPAEQLILAMRENKARSRSRIPAGIWLLPSGLDLEAYEDEDSSGLDGFANELVRKMSQPISDPGDPQSLVPWIIEMDSEDIEAAAKGLVNFAREFRTSPEETKELLTRLATGLDLPAEIFLGLADTNHWTSFLVTEDAVSKHAAPTVDEILESLTFNWLHALLDIPENVVLWRDLSPATIPADRSELTLKAHDRYLISDDAARTQLDYNEEDAPSPEEIADRLVRNAPRSSASLPGVPDTDRPGTAALVAAVDVISGVRLAEIDRSLLSWTVTQAEAVVEKVTEKVGARLKSAAQANGAKDLVRDVEPGRVASVLGPSQIALVAQGFDLVSEEDFAGFAQRLEERIGRSQAETSKFIEELTGEPVEDWDNEAAVALIVAALVAAVEGSLFRPDAQPDPADVGEVLDTTVPVGAIREGLDMAGGGPAVYQGSEASELVGNGATATETLRVRGYRSLSFRWQYGDPAARMVNFEPHQRLDGVVFESWDDEVLAHSGWPTDSLRPSDHKGCLCSYVRELTVTPALVSV